MRGLKIRQCGVAQHERVMLSEAALRCSSSESGTFMTEFSIVGLVQESK